MLQPKDIDWLNGYINKTCIYAVYNRPTSDLGKHWDRSKGMGKVIQMKIGRSGVAIFISDKIDFKDLDKEGHYVSRGQSKEKI